VGGQSTGLDSAANSGGGGSSGIGLTVPDAGAGTGGGAPCPAYLGDCKAQGFNCGPATDGCGNALDCGTCTTSGDSCGGGGTLNVCGHPGTCKSKTCADQNFNCGMVSDGCNNIIDCGTCPSGQTCGAGGKDDVCGTGGSCPPKTCQQQGFNCGMAGDGCGTVIDCGVCTGTASCGGGANPKPNVCGSLSCTPKSCTDQGFNCGMATDGCNGIISCGTCSGSQACGADPTKPNVCATSVTCTGLCLKQTPCSGGATTSISGTVYAPNGVDPLPNTLVYVPNGDPTQNWGVKPFVDGVSVPHCGCGTDVSGNPLVSAVTDYKGQFIISNMPVGTNIPLVIQNGRWRRQFTIPTVAMCTNTALPSTGAQQLRMPRTKAEGNIPKIGFVTGAADALECVLRKIGIADSEFNDPGQGARVDFYLGNTANGPGFNGGPGAQYSFNTPDESQLWGTQSTINGYDMLFFACMGDEYDRDPAAEQTLINYANAGGRAFTTHYGYVWLFDDAPFSTTATWNVNNNSNFVGVNQDGPETGYIVTTFPKGLLLAQWLQYIGASTTQGQMQINTLRDDFSGINASTSQLWVYVNDPNYPPKKPMHYTFNTPVGAAPANQCGRVLYDDFHVEDAPNGNDQGATFPDECILPGMTPQEKMLEFMIFDLGSCVTPSSCTPKTCTSLNVQCGPAGDGCGNIIQCGACASGQACIAGKCASNGCTPQTCMQQGFACGMQGDGCGNSIDCGACASGQTCGAGGVVGKCSTGTCTPKTCAQQGYACGSIGDGCGNILPCGTCAAGQICGGNGMPGQCYTPPCTAKTCTQLGYDCGQANDGCGHIITCGTCSGTQTCGGGGSANVCGGGAG
jgi:hypothetical protein